MRIQTITRRSVWRLAIVFFVGFAILTWGFALTNGEYGTALLFSLPAILAWAAFVWPTEWRYHTHRGYLVRANRFDGAIEVFTQFGWALIEEPSEAAVTGHTPATFGD